MGYAPLADACFSQVACLASALPLGTGLLQTTSVRASALFPPFILNPPILRQRHGQSCCSETADILRWLVSGQATALALWLGSDSGEDNIIRMGNDWCGDTSGSGHKLSPARLRHTVLGSLSAGHRDSEPLAVSSTMTLHGCRI